MDKIHVYLTDFQERKIAKAFRNKNNVTIRLQQSQLDNVSDALSLSPAMMHKVDLIRTHGQAKDIKIAFSELKEMKEGGFLQFLIPAAVGLVGSLIGAKGLSKKDSRDYEKIGEGLRLRTGSGLYLKTDNKLYDISDTKEGSGFLSGILKVLPTIAKKVLPALGIGALTGASSEAATQIIKKISGKKGDGLFLKHGGKMYDLSETVEGSGLIRSLIGKKIPLLSDLPIIGDLLF